MPAEAAPASPAGQVAGQGGWEPFEIDAVFARLRRACAGLPKAAMFDLRDRGHGTSFEQLVSSLISARTLEHTTMAASLRLFAVARTPADVVALGHDGLLPLIRDATFPEAKARDILALSQAILDRHSGQVPDTMEGLTAFRGVGPKIAALTLAVGFGQPAIPVDIHVHRVANRWGYVRTTTPERTLAALQAKLPRRYWIEINERLVPFGKYICTGPAPKCPSCPLLSMCRQVGVKRPGSL